MKNLNEKVVALTGAGSGIGRCLAIQLSQLGTHLSLADVDEEGLKETKALLSKDIIVSTHLVDVADRGQVYAWAEETIKAHGHVDCIINNAGVAFTASIEEINYKDFDWVFKIVFYGVLYGTKAFLPYLKNRPDAHIVNISSVNGFIATPRNGAYACAKHAVKALNQTLQQELKNTSVNVTSVHPGGVRTNIARNSGSDDSEEIQQERIVGFDQIAGTSAEKAATIIIKSILKNRKRQLVGVDAMVIDVLSRLFPQKFSDAMGCLYGYTQRKRIKDI
ncbi:MAG: SDR family NAD(P)-dependent oxidoreductase [Proteobacteria bacterium]|jgi:short-subunit dehydrogenase|nr:SDR family NAD(P)-dependent oxidoreductase [Pseudomonadota bacterium]MDA1341551.1 SDR family NAD(P)-dependent oxidoreductase [Pseudomonadota bacterium]